jgi:hypothetical protein
MKNLNRQERQGKKMKIRHGMLRKMIQWCWIPDGTTRRINNFLASLAVQIISPYEARA